MYIYPLNFTQHCTSRHDSENTTRVDGCQEPGCFTHPVTYTISLEQIRVVISNAEICRQYVSVSFLVAQHPLSTY